MGPIPSLEGLAEGDKAGMQGIVLKAILSKFGLILKFGHVMAHLGGFPNLGV